jgi:hypothetical protein
LEEKKRGGEGEEGGRQEAAKHRCDATEKDRKGKKKKSKMMKVE